MARQPKWFTQLRWSAPQNIAVINADRGMIPIHPGVYAFTTHSAALSPDRVLYIGAAKNGLHARLTSGAYLIRQITQLPPRTDGAIRKFHKGAAFVLEARVKRHDHGVYLRWAEYGAGPEHILDLEASLQDYLKPSRNDRDESLRRPLLGDWEGLIPGAY